MTAARKSKVIGGGMSNGQTRSEREAADEADGLTRALLPTVERAIRISVRRDSRPLVDAIFPVMGPAIRKSISEALRSMVQSLSRSLENSFSIRGLRWRLEAWRTGRPFAEVVLLNSLVYRVEQVFLIHRESGVLLQHVRPGVEEDQDADMVSAMLTAIRDFVQDSFRPGDSGSLETIRLGDVNVWVEDGPRAILAAVVRGTAPESLRTVFSGAQEAIQAGFARQLDAFDGDTAPFEATRPLLEGCLAEQRKARGQKINPLVIVIPAVILCAIAVPVGFRISGNIAWDDLVRDVGRRPGVVVLESGREGKGGFIRGLRDPASGDLADLFVARGFDSSLIRQEWTPIQVGYRPYELARITRALVPPSGVRLTLREDRTLVVSGEAGHQWMDRAMLISRAFPGISRVDFNTLVDIDRTKAAQLAASLETVSHLFDVASSSLSSEEFNGVTRAASAILGLLDVARRAHFAVTVRIAGRADPTGPDSRNRVLSQERAAFVRDLLVAMGVPPRVLTTEGLGTARVPGAAPAHNRCVTYQIRLESVCHD